MLPANLSRALVLKIGGSYRAPHRWNTRIKFYGIIPLFEKGPTKQAPRREAHNRPTDAGFR